MEKAAKISRLAGLRCFFMVFINLMGTIDNRIRYSTNRKDEWHGDVLNLTTTRTERIHPGADQPSPAMVHPAVRVRKPRRPARKRRTDHRAVLEGENAETRTRLSVLRTQRLAVSHPARPWISRKARRSHHLGVAARQLCPRPHARHQPARTQRHPLPHRQWLRQQPRHAARRIERRRRHFSSRHLPLPQRNDRKRNHGVRTADGAWMGTPIRPVPCRD